MKRKQPKVEDDKNDAKQPKKDEREKLKPKKENTVNQNVEEECKNTILFYMYNIG